jgi:hypothetical protein
VDRQMSVKGHVRPAHGDRLQLIVSAAQVHVPVPVSGQVERDGALDGAAPQIEFRGIGAAGNPVGLGAKAATTMA